MKKKMGLIEVLGHHFTDQDLISMLGGMETVPEHVLGRVIAQSK